MVNQIDLDIELYENDYVKNLCKQTCKILDELIKIDSNIIKNSCFVYVGINKGNYGINTESWHCITINYNSLISIDPPIRKIICDLIIDNIKFLITEFNYTLPSLY